MKFVGIRKREKKSSRMNLAQDMFALAQQVDNNAFWLRLVDDIRELAKERGITDCKVKNLNKDIVQRLRDNGFRVINYGGGKWQILWNQS